MRIGIRVHDMERAPFEEMIQNISSKGFCCAQLAVKKAISEFNVDIDAMTPGMAFYIKEIFAKNKVDIAVLGCYLNLTNLIDQERKQILEAYKTHIRFASLLSCGMVGTETGSLNPDYTFKKSNHSEAALDIFIENIKRLVDYAEKMGVIIGIEPVYKHIVSNLERTYRVISEVKSPNLQIIFDPVNLLSYDNYKEQDDIIKGAFQLFGKDIAAIHSKDFRVENKEIVETATGCGSFHHELLLAFIKKQKPFIHVLLEGTKPSESVTARKYLEEIYQNISAKEG
ncbi:sugar phosphate isomerase/epimerase family protein [Anaerocolumna sp. MB42-C2]|uniref:sugar phosphate isomerase/epimerase family protein n=1 Tax=Anaerocolumna sp. MB42-C2 TaxID=3070997 RepID=UPI0027E1A972|nr:sugar phosphate isomerase/epimerase family protein [Anaerocolumna sp. MB42-C2]WMJ88325.1 sugar phosphate isomerase/epimerase family protein [Anaerocolumna sp. MB42-C2]